MLCTQTATRRRGLKDLTFSRPHVRKENLSFQRRICFPSSNFMLFRGHQCKHIQSQMPGLAYVSYRVTVTILVTVLQEVRTCLGVCHYLGVFSWTLLVTWVSPFQLEYIESFDISYHCEAKEKGFKPTKTLGLGSSPSPSRTLSSFSDGRALLVR